MLLIDNCTLDLDVVHHSRNGLGLGVYCLLHQALLVVGFTHLLPSHKLFSYPVHRINLEWY